VKKILFITVFVLVMLLPFISSAEQIYYNDSYHEYDAETIKLNVNGKEVQGLTMHPVIIDDYTMVPVREVFEALESEVLWHDDTCQVEIIDNGVSVLVKIGDRNVFVNSAIIPIDEGQPLPMLIGMSPDELKSMVPVRFIAEKLGFTVEWDEKTRTVSIYENKDTPTEIIGGIKDDGEFFIPDKEGVFGKVVAETDEKYDYIYIAAGFGISPTVTRYTAPERISFDFPDAQFLSRGGRVPLDGNCVENVRFSNHETHARLVLDVKDEAQVMILSSDRGILIRVEKSPNTQIIYDAFSGRVYFDKKYVGTGKRVENGYSVTFSDLGLQNQKIEIHDKNFYEIIISRTAAGCNITVDGSNKMTYTSERGFFKDSGIKPTQKPQVDNDGRKVVVIDAGHGGEDPGAVGYNKSGKAVAYESHINLAIALLVGEKLENDGIRVIYTRDSDKYISLKERSELSNNSECDMFVSIHCNSIENGAINGTQVYFHPASENGTVLADNIYKNIVDMTGLAPKETQNGAHLYVIRTTTSPAVLVETAFISNESDRNYLISKEGQNTLAEAIYKGIVETFE